LVQEGWNRFGGKVVDEEKGVDRENKVMLEETIMI